MAYSQDPIPTIQMRKIDRRPQSGATPYNVQFSVDDSPGWTHVGGLKQESADKASELLMLNHAKYHTLFNEVGLHNHIVHHLCTLWALGASPSEIQAAYDLNKKYQLPHYHHGASMSLKMRDPEFSKKCLGESEYYTDYLQFFQDELARRDVGDVVREYVFQGDERAVDMLGRMYSGFEHPILHLGFAIEFNQPCLVAEALASACIHDDWPLPIVLPVEENISSHPDTPYNSMLSVVEALHSDPRIYAAATNGDPPNRVTDALMAHGAQDVIPILAKWRVKPTKEDIEYRTAEMAHMCTYMSGAAQNPKKEPSIEFFMLHSTNLSVFYPAFMGVEWLSLEQKARLLTWKGWMDLVMYAACATPTLYHARITDYTPKIPGDWSTIISRVNRYPDDGHTAKFIRALLNAHNVSQPYFNTSNPDFPLRKEDFLQIAHMTMDSVERMLDPEYKLPEKTRRMYVKVLGVDDEVVKIICRFVRWCGIKRSWEDFPDLKEGKAKL